MISRLQAAALLEYINSLGKDAELVLSEASHKSFSPNIVCVTDDELAKLGIKEQALDDHITTWYDGKETHHPRAEAPLLAHVFNKAGLRAYIDSNYQGIGEFTAGE